MSTAVNAALYRRIAVRVAPMLIILYFVAFLDRVNISFAALTMNRDLGINDVGYGLAAGIFFAGYLVFAVPANLALVRFGARRWIGILVATWGLLSMGLAFVHTVPQYVVLRFLVGSAEAGFYPGVIFYLTQWLPSRSRAGIMAAFTFAIPLSNVIGSPISAWILRTHWSGAFAGWQWLFLLEGAPAVLLGCLTPFVLASGPSEVSWLSGEEKQTLALAMEEDCASRAAATGDPDSRCASFASLILPTLTYFTLMSGLYTLGFWVPKMLTRLGVPLTQIGWLTAIPFAVGGAGMLIWSRWSDNKQERRNNLVIALFVAGSGMVITGLAPAPWIALVGLSFTTVGVFSAMPIFWAGFSQCIPEQQAAVSIAIVNNVGQLAGFFGPLIIGVLVQRTHHYAPGLAVTAGCLFSGVVLVLCNRRLRAVQML
jgi:ACS family tartrate transporter-like MFS transporter